MKRKTFDEWIKENEWVEDSKGEAYDAFNAHNPYIYYLEHRLQYLESRGALKLLNEIEEIKQENKNYETLISIYRKTLEKIVGMAGAPNAVDACRSIVKLINKDLG